MTTSKAQTDADMHADLRRSSSFASAVLAAVRRIPRGKTATYKEVARRAGKPKAYRAVGNILKKNYDPRVPCHRVICSDGRPGGYNRGFLKKAKLLKREGVKMKRGRAQKGARPQR